LLLFLLAKQLFFDPKMEGLKLNCLVRLHLYVSMAGNRMILESRIDCTSSDGP